MSRFALFGKFFLALLLWLTLSSTAIASARQMPTQPLQPPEDVTRAGVSVVRLLVSYADPKGSANASIAQCTGLGVLVAGWTAQKQGEFNNWILTDGNLVSPDQATCASSHPSARLETIEIYSSSAYNPQAIQLTLNGSITIHCDATPCSNGPALFSFGTQPNNTRPYLDIDTKDTSQTTGIGLTQLTSPTASKPEPFNTTTQVQNIAAFHQQAIGYLTPQEVPLSDSKLEFGTPVVNQAGNLTGLYLSNQATSATADVLTAFINRTITGTRGPNPVHDNWNKGIDAFYQKNNSVAHAAFLAASTANPQFQAARDLAQQTQTTQAGRENGQPTPTPSVGGITVNGQPVSYRLLVIVLSLLILVGLLILTSVLFGRARAQRAQRARALKADLAEAERRAAVDAQRIAEAEAAQQGWPQQITQPAPVISGPLPNPELPCPNCGKMVPRDANFCPNCRLVLSPTESGLHLRVFPQSPEAPPPPGAVPPTPVLPATPAPVATSRSIAEQPTIEIGPGAAKNGQTEAEKTLPYAMQQVKGKRLGFAVVTRTDPGIKRKYKPNEDSLFAAQGMVNNNATPQRFGLFVIADGMGGHANGQDASRLAIQTIIDYVLPKLTKSEQPLSSHDYEQLMVEGVQTANQAVHQQNMDQRGDMGTTMTGALLVDSIAYVANVGDSRTYLYREGEGLKKVTNDHSVVASLVEAGIIKPDDIYTHPKRNQIYRSLGEKPAVEVDSFVVQLQPGDKLLLCSDGLWDMVRDPKIEEVVKAPVPDPGATGDALIQAALDGGGEDNVSVIVVQFTEATKAPKGPRFQLLAKPDTVQVPKL